MNEELINQIEKELPENEKEKIQKSLSSLLLWLIEQQALESLVIRFKAFYPPELIEEVKARKKEYQRLIRLTEKTIGKIAITKSEYLADKTVKDYILSSDLENFYAAGMALYKRLRESRKKNGRKIAT